MERIELDIAKEFNEKLGGRWIKLGPFSGELFYSEYLRPKYNEAIKNGVKLYVKLDGTKGYGSSFLDQSFGQLARDYGKENVQDNLVFETVFFTWIVKYINEEIWK
jgi:hypothetical protein